MAGLLNFALSLRCLSAVVSCIVSCHHNRSVSAIIVVKSEQYQCFVMTLGGIR